MHHSGPHWEDSLSMPKVRIVTDSAVLLDLKSQRELDITIMPLTIRLGNEVFREGVDISAQQFLERLRQPGAYPRIEPPSAGDFIRLYESIGAQGDIILSLHHSRRLSKTVRAAEEAAASLVGRQKVEVIDTESISYGQGILVRAAARAAAAGEDLASIIRLVRGMIPRVYAIFFSDTLDYLEHTGRIGPAQSILGTMLQIKPILVMEDGEIIPMEKVRSHEEAVEKLYEFIAEFSEVEELVILRNPYFNNVPLLLERLKELFPKQNIPVYTYGPSLAAHIGPYAVGAVIYEGL
jgi:DegV family protein with EDD domain